MNILLPIGGIVLGTVIGLAFGAIQNAALKRHKKLQQDGKFTSGWSIMPGSMRRTAFLLMALAAVQILCPMLFEDGIIQWLISAGVMLGYGWSLFKPLRHHASLIL